MTDSATGDQRSSLLAAQSYVNDPRSGLDARPTILALVEALIERARHLHVIGAAMLSLVDLHSSEAARLISDAEVFVPQELSLADQMELLDLLEVKEVIDVFELLLNAASFRDGEPSVGLGSWLRRAQRSRETTWPDVPGIQEAARNSGQSTIEHPDRFSPP